MTDSAQNLQVVLTSRPAGWISEENFAVRPAPMPTPGEGQVLTRNIYLSCDPYLRGLMNGTAGSQPGQALDQPIRARVVAEVLESCHPDHSVGDLVWGFLGWELHSLVPETEKLYPVEPALGPISHFISILGMPGLTAYVGMMEIGEPCAGETVFVSSAAGAVGQIAGQLARLQGARVVGSVGSDAKVAYLSDTLQFDAAFNYKSETDIAAALAQHCPNGIDVYFENVGGKTLDAVLSQINPHARIAVCGMISQYNADQPDPIFNLGRIVRNRVKMQGFVVGEHLKKLPDFSQRMSAWLADGRIRYREDIVDGIENTPKAFVGMFKGENIGKRLVRVAPDPTMA
ncbi:MAG: NADP-dependent oxidoreductase [Alphaproteobacteria bacterium]|nr:NADP-dependent oxidoreductase [Alphaproteobacteria bacterium]